MLTLRQSVRFSWEEERHFLLRCELDAAFLHFYLGPEIERRAQPAALTRAFSGGCDVLSSPAPTDNQMNHER